MEDHRKMPDMEEVYNTYFPVIYNYVYYKLLNRENTEDIVSQVFMKVVRHLNRFDAEKASLKTWIFRITDNTLTDYYRKQRPQVSMNDEACGLDNILHVNFEDQYERKYSSARAAVNEALKTLPEKERMFIYYKYYLGITNREIARQMNMNENTVSAILARTRKKLKDVLADEYLEG